MIRVLLIDHQVYARHALAYRLHADPASRFHVVGEASSPAKASSLLEVHQPDVIVVAGLRRRPRSTILPPPLEPLRDAAPSVPILALTATVSAPERALLIADGVQGVLPHHSALDDVVDAIVSIAQGEPLLSPEEIHAAHEAVAIDNARAQDVCILSTRELAVLRLVAQGLTNKEIGEDLGIRHLTVNAHVRNIFGKLDADSRTTAVVIAYQRGLLPESDTSR